MNDWTTDMGGFAGYSDSAGMYPGIGARGTFVPGSLMSALIGGSQLPGMASILYPGQPIGKPEKKVAASEKECGIGRSCLDSRLSE